MPQMRVELITIITWRGPLDAHSATSPRVSSRVNSSRCYERSGDDRDSEKPSKHALESYSRSAAAELGPFGITGITVNIVSPGPVQTGYMTPEMEEELVGDIPLRRVGRPEDVADVIVFLASEQARWITGQLLCVHGGHRMSLGL